MSSQQAGRIIDRATELLWAIALCDVENVSAHRSVLLRGLDELERLAAQARITDLYTQVVHHDRAITGA